MITEPIQNVYNTLYFQSQFEKDSDFGVNSNTPANEYLSRLINLNMKTLLNTNFNNCILSGFDVSVSSVSNNKLYLNIFPGLAILNSYLFELVNIQENIEIELNNTNSKYLLVSLKYKNYDSNFNFEFDFLDSNKNSLILNNNYNELLPIKIFKLEFKNNTINILNLEDNNILYMGGDFDNTIIHHLITSLYLDTLNLNTLSKYTNLNKLLDFPKKHVINNKEHLIPNYGKHYDFATKLIKTLYQNYMMNMIFTYPVRHSHECFN